MGQDPIYLLFIRTEFLDTSEYCLYEQFVNSKIAVDKRSLLRYYSSKLLNVADLEGGDEAHGPKQGSYSG